MPQSDPSLQIVRNCRIYRPRLLLNYLAVDESLSQTSITGVNASVNIEVDKEATLSIVIDKANGDFLN
jgi:hypothetical protein